MTRVALVGCGAISRAHAAAVDASGAFELAAVVDADPAARARASDEYGVPGFESVDTLLERGEVDVACVCTPPATHRALVEALLSGGLDVLCEKPLATTVEDAEAMLARARTTGRHLLVSDKFRHVATLREAGERIRTGAVGQVVTYAVSFCAPVDVRGRWPAMPELSGGGVLMDNAPHAFDVLSHVLEDPIVDVELWRAEPIVAPPVEDTAVLQFRTSGGGIGRIELSWLYYTKDLDYLVVQGAEGTVRVGWTGGQVRSHGDREWVAFGPGYSKEAAFAAMWDRFRTRGEGTHDASHALQALRWIEAAYGRADAAADSGA